MKPIHLVRSLLSYVNSSFNNHNSSSGFAFVAIILIVVLVFSITLVSGSKEFGFSPPEGGKSSDSSSSSPAPIGSSSATIQPTQPASTSNWTAIASLTGCTVGKEPYMSGTIDVTGNSAGTVTLEVQNGSAFNPTISVEYTPPTTRYNLSLLNSKNFNTQNWRIRMQDSSGSSDVIYEGTPTGC